MRSYKLWLDTIYEDTHTHIIEEFYMATDMNFGEALEHLQAGHRVRRVGWNNSEAFLKLHTYTPQYFALDLDENMTLPYIYIEYPEGSKSYPEGARVPWLASQTDMLANDWMTI